MTVSVSDVRAAGRTEGESTAETNAIQYEAEPGTCLSTAVVFAVAEAQDADPLTFHERAVLADSVDPDALDTLYETAEDWRVVFELAGSEVTVEGDGSIAVRLD